MTAWMIYYREGAIYNKSYIDFYLEEGSKLGIVVKLILVEDLEFGVKQNQWFLKYQGKEIPYPDFVICRAIYPLLSKQLELMGMKVFNNSSVAEICNDKAKTYQYLAKTGITMVDSSFYRNQQVKDIISEVVKPTVIKAVDGHGGSQVFLLKQEKESQYDIQGGFQANSNNNFQGSLQHNYINNLSDSLQQNSINNYKDSLHLNSNNIMEGIGSSDVVVQPLTGNTHQDLRVYVIGKEILAGVLRTAKEGFKSNYSLGGDASLYKLTGDEKRIVNKVINQFDFGLVGIDFIIGDDGELIFNEIEDVVGSRMLYQCSNINIVELYLKFIIKSLHRLSL